MTLTCKSYYENIHSVDISHVSSPFSGLNLLKISVQQSHTMAYTIPFWAGMGTSKACGGPALNMHLLLEPVVLGLQKTSASHTH